ESGEAHGRDDDRAPKRRTPLARQRPAGRAHEQREEHDPAGGESRVLDARDGARARREGDDGRAQEGRHDDVERYAAQNGRHGALRILGALAGGGYTPPPGPSLPARAESRRPAAPG